MKGKTEIKKYYYDRNARNKELNINPKTKIVVRKKNMWEPAEVIKRHDSPRSIIIRDKNNRIKRRNEIDLKVSITSHNMNKTYINNKPMKPQSKNKYWSNKKIKLNNKEEIGEIETQKIDEGNSLEKEVNEGDTLEKIVVDAEDRGTDNKFKISKYGRKTKIIN